MKIVLIHGAGATNKSFNYVTEKLSIPNSELYYYSYSHSDEAHVILSQLILFLAKFDEPVILIGHSLGGLLSVAAMQSTPNSIQKVITITSPFSGSQMADMMKWINSHPLFASISSDSLLLKTIKSKPLQRPVHCIIGTKGLPIIPAPNDGVVTVSSQKALVGSKTYEFNLNHFEVLLDEEVCKEISKIVVD